jgi:PAS domain S-box-containing protein
VQLQDLGIDHLLESVRDAVIIADAHTGRIVLWNEAATRIFGYPSSEALEHCWSIIVPERLRAECEAGMSRYRDTGRGPYIDSHVVLELPAVRKDGTEITVEIVLSPLNPGASNGRRLVLAIVRDITERKLIEEEIRQLNESLERLVAERTEQLEKAMAELRESAERFRSLVLYASDIIAVLEADGAIRYISPSVERTLAYRSEELIGEQFFGYVHPEDATQVNRAFAELLEHHGLNPALDFRVRHRYGSWRYLEAVANNLLADPSVRGIVVNARDVTERTLAEQEVRRLNGELERRVRHRTAQLEASNSELEAFNYSISHDLRAPLRAIAGFSRILLEDYSGVLDEEGQDYLRRVRAASGRMGRLIDALLDLSRTTRGEMRRERVDLSALVVEIAGELEQSEPERHVDLRVEQGLVVEGDVRLLRVALESLLANAWKFTGDRPDPRVEFGALGRAQAFFVRDNGVGFDERYADKLFAPFQRLHGEGEFEGTGVGLAAVRRIVHRHGGRVWAEGEVGRGATFYFTM